MLLWYLLIGIDLVSLLFLNITMIIYLLLPRLTRRLPGKIQLSHMISLFLSYLGLIIFNVKDPYYWLRGNKTKGVCMSAGLYVYFVQMSSFFWFSIYSFNFHSNICSFENLRNKGTELISKQDETKRFVIFSIIAWGCPMLMTVSLLAIEYIPDEVIPAFISRPHVGYSSCWFKDWYSSFWYYLLPVLLLLLINVIFFIRTVIFMIRFGKEKKQHFDTVGSFRITNAVPIGFVLYSKIFVIMGISCLVDGVAFSYYNNDDGDDDREIGISWWMLPKLLNSLQGIFIFLTYNYKSRTFDTNDTFFVKLKKSFPHVEKVVLKLKETFKKKLQPSETDDVRRNNCSTINTSIYSVSSE